MASRASSRKPKETHRKCPCYLIRSLVKLGSFAQERSQYVTRSRGWQYSYPLGPRIRINEHMELACDARSFAHTRVVPTSQFFSCLWAFPSRTCGVHHRLPNGMGDRRKRLPIPTAFVSSFLGASCFLEHYDHVFPSSQGLSSRKHSAMSAPHLLESHFGGCLEACKIEEAGPRSSVHFMNIARRLNFQVFIIVAVRCGWCF